VGNPPERCSLTASPDGIDLTAGEITLRVPHSDLPLFQEGLALASAPPLPLPSSTYVGRALLLRPQFGEGGVALAVYGRLPDGGDSPLGVLAPPHIAFFRTALAEYCESPSGKSALGASTMRAR